MLDVLLLRAESFFFSLDAIYEILGLSKLQFLIKEISFFFNWNFISSLVISTLDLDSHPDPK
jgi:hypothetical protein